MTVRDAVGAVTRVRGAALDWLSRQWDDRLSASLLSTGIVALMLTVALLSSAGIWY